jgi:polar amino acid transport system substrate-binding protein
VSRCRRALGSRRGLPALGVVAPVVVLGVLLYAGDGEAANHDTGGPVLRVCSDPDNLPFSSAGAGERGLYVEVAELVAAALGVRTEYVWWRTFYGKRALRNTLLADRCDAFFGVPHHDDFMGRDLILTRPFLDVGWAIIAPMGLAFLHVDDLKSRRLAVVFGSTPQLLLAARGGFRTATFRTDEEALDALTGGEVDAAFVWGPIAGYHNVRKLGGAYRVVSVAGEGLQWQAAVAVRKGRDPLRDRIDRALAALRSEIRHVADGYGFPHGPAIALALSTDVDPIAAGRSVFNQHCSHCHAPNALSPEPSRDLRRLRLRYGAAASEVFYTAVTRGRPDKGMPPWNNLDPATVQRLWTFLDSVQMDR